jgi:hypothetical protein
MYDFEKEEDKRRMLAIMKEYHFETETNKDSSYEEVEAEFKAMNEELEAIDHDMGEKQED